MSPAPRPRPEFLVIEGGPGRAVERLTSSPALQLETPRPHVVDLAQVRSQARPELPPRRSCEPNPHWCVGLAAAGVFLAGLGLLTFGIVWTSGVLMHP